MWKKRIDISGSRYGRLVVLKYDHTDKEGRACWQCLCDCGNVVVVSGKSLRTGNTKSCGCYNIEKATERIVKRNTIHGDSHTRLFRIWALMHTRCNNPHAINYADYGGRGIKVCKEWDKYEPFRDWALTNGYAENLSIDRIDTNGDYTPRNCQWATSKQQANNRRSNRIIEFRGEKRTVSQWAENAGISKNAMLNRLKSDNFTLEEALMSPYLRRRNGQALYAKRRLG